MKALWMVSHHELDGWVSEGLLLISSIMGNYSGLAYFEGQESHTAYTRCTITNYE